MTDFTKRPGGWPLPPGFVRSEFPNGDGLQAALTRQAEHQRLFNGYVTGPDGAIYQPTFNGLGLITLKRVYDGGELAAKFEFDLSTGPAALYANGLAYGDGKIIYPDAAYLPATFNGATMTPTYPAAGGETFGVQGAGVVIVKLVGPWCDRSGMLAFDINATAQYLRSTGNLLGNIGTKHMLLHLVTVVPPQGTRVFFDKKGASVAQGATGIALATLNDNKYTFYASDGTAQRTVVSGTRVPGQTRNDCYTWDRRLAAGLKLWSSLAIENSNGGDATAVGDVSNNDSMGIGAYADGNLPWGERWGALALYTSDDDEFADAFSDLVAKLQLGSAGLEEQVTGAIPNIAAKANAGIVEIVDPVSGEIDCTTVQDKWPRICHDFTEDGDLWIGYLAELARVNLALFPNDLSNAVWTKLNGTTLSGTKRAWEHGKTITGLVGAAATDSFGVSQAIAAVPAVQHCLSFFCGPGKSEWLRAKVAEIPGCWFWVDMRNRRIGSVGPGAQSVGIRPYFGGLSRPELRVLNTAEQTLTVSMIFADRDGGDGTDPTVVGDGSSIEGYLGGALFDDAGWAGTYYEGSTRGTDRIYYNDLITLGADLQGMLTYRTIVPSRANVTPSRYVVTLGSADTDMLGAYYTAGEHGGFLYRKTPFPIATLNGSSFIHNGIPFENVSLWGPNGVRPQLFIDAQLVREALVTDPGQFISGAVRLNLGMTPSQGACPEKPINYIRVRTTRIDPL